MANTRGKGGAGKGASAETPAGTAPRSRRARTRAPEDEISGVAAPEPPAAKTAGRVRGASAPPAKEAAAPKKRGRAPRESYAETAARRREEKEVDWLQADLRAFATARPGGWNHEDWIAFLAHLGERGHDVSDPEGIGSRLEQERLAVVLGGIGGLGPKRVQSLVERFHTLWSMRHAGADEVAAVPGMTRPVAQRLADELRTRFPD